MRRRRPFVYDHILPLVFLLLDSMFLAKCDMTLDLLVSDVSTSLGCIFHEEGARSAERHAAERPWRCTPSQPQEILTGR